MSELNDLPNGWIKTKFSEITNKIVDGSHNPPPKADLGLPMLSARNIEGGLIKFEEDYRLISEQDFEREDRRTKIKSGDILLTIVGAIGRCAVVPKNIQPFTLQRSVAVLSPVEVDSQFLSYQLQSPNLQKDLLSRAKGTAQKGVYLKSLNELTIDIPPLNEQRRIVSSIEQLTDRSHKARAALEDVPKLIAQFRQSVLAAAFRGDLTADWREKNPNFKVYESFAHAHEDAKGWVTLKAEDVCNVQSGSTPKGKPFTEVGDIPYLKVYNIVGQRIDFNYRPQFIPIEVHRKELKRCVTLPGDVLMNIVGPPLGKIAIVTNQFQQWNINQALVLFRPNTGLSNKYLYYFLREGKFIREIDNETKGSVGQVNISLTQCRQCLIPIPSKEEQEEIVQRIGLMFQQIDRIYQQYEQAKAWIDTLDRSILAKAFRGELVPQDPNDKPAAALLDRIRAERAGSERSRSDRTSTTKQRGQTTRKNSSKQLSIDLE